MDCWTYRFADLFRVNHTSLQKIKRTLLHLEWVRLSIAANKPYDQIAREYVVGTQRFQGMAGRIGVPADCRVLHLNYSYALSRNPVLITETAHRLVGGDYAGLHRMLSTVGRDLDEKYAAADSELSRLCGEYNVRKSFTIGDNGGGGGSILGF